MTELLERQLDQVAVRMGALLRGFDDPAVHLGTPEQFAREFRKLFDIPVLEDRMSYRDALGALHAPAIETEAAEPVAVLIRGLGEPPPNRSVRVPEIPLDVLLRDLGRLLRVPVLRFYLVVADRNLFLSEVDHIARHGNYRVGDSETFRMLPMASTVASVISYELLREVVSLRVVESYQEETAIRPVALE